MLCYKCCCSHLSTKSFHNEIMRTVRQNKSNIPTAAYPSKCWQMVFIPSSLLLQNNNYSKTIILITHVYIVPYPWEKKKKPKNIAIVQSTTIPMKNKPTSNSTSTNKHSKSNTKFQSTSTYIHITTSPNWYTQKCIKLIQLSQYPRGRK